eukprot:UN11349
MPIIRLFSVHDIFKLNCLAKVRCYVWTMRYYT